MSSSISKDVRPWLLQRLELFCLNFPSLVDSFIEANLNLNFRWPGELEGRDLEKEFEFAKRELFREFERMLLIELGIFNLEDLPQLGTREDLRIALFKYANSKRKRSIRGTE